jgi:hypothetical protein
MKGLTYNIIPISTKGRNFIGNIGKEETADLILIHPKILFNSFFCYMNSPVPIIFFDLAESWSKIIDFP